MATIPKGKSLKARLVLELEDEDGVKETVEVHKIEIGPRIYYYDYRTGETIETSMTYSEYTELKESDDTIQKKLEPTDRMFFVLNIFGLMSPAEHSDHKEGMRIVYHDKVEDGVDPYSLMLGRKE